MHHSGADEQALDAGMKTRDATIRPPTLCLEAMQYKTLSAASGVAYEEARHLSRS